MLHFTYNTFKVLVNNVYCIAEAQCCKANLGGSGRPWFPSLFIQSYSLSQITGINWKFIRRLYNRLWSLKTFSCQSRHTNMIDETIITKYPYSLSTFVLAKSQIFAFIALHFCAKKIALWGIICKLHFTQNCVFPLLRYFVIWNKSQ